MNTAFQCLLHNKGFMRYTRSIPDEPRNLVSCFKNVKSEQKVMVEQCVADLGKLFDFREENDLQEFYLACVNKMCDQIGTGTASASKIAEYEDKVAKSKSKHDRFYASLDLKWWQDNKKSYSQLIPIFNGQVVVQTKCNKCGYFCQNVEMFMTIDLGMMQECSSLDKMLDKYFESEQLTVWKCDRCNLSDATKMQQISRLPRTLTISLKRFNGKHPVDIPEVITLPESSHAMDQVCTYRLFAIGCHQGDQTGGHYYAVCKASNSSWNILNDRHVLPVSDIHRHTGDAYMLFYEWV